jgi:two-component system chemotaxis response regulator CheB
MGEPRIIQQHKICAVVIGTSAGGVAALAEIFARLPNNFPAAILVVIHLHPHSSCGHMVNYLSSRCELPIKSADDKEKIQPGTIYLAPANYHVLVERDFTLALTIDEKVNYSRPAIDVLFETAAEAYQDELLGIVLTGGSKDGAAGLRRICALGGCALVQDPESAEAFIMPQSALQHCENARVLLLAEIGEFLRGAVQDDTLVIDAQSCSLN